MISKYKIIFPIIVMALAIFGIEQSIIKKYSCERVYFKINIIGIKAEGTKCK